MSSALNFILNNKTTYENDFGYTGVEGTCPSSVTSYNI